ncbi:MAG: Gp15 family bacteriophage protein [Bacilli bacterium]
MNYPKYVEVADRRYKINTDFRVAIECNRIAEDETIGDFERALAIIYKLFGEEGLNHQENYEFLLDLAKKFLCCGKELENTNEKPDMDYIQDMDYIEASFMSDYHIDLASTEMHWWKFNNLMNGLSNSEIGNCCVLNRVRNLRTYDTKDIKDPKELERINKAKKQVALKLRKEHVKLTKAQQKGIENFYKMTGITRKE